MSEEKKPTQVRAVIDRIEDDGVAVLLVGTDERRVELPASLLPEGAEPGSHLSVTFALDEASRKEAEERVKALQERLEQRGGQEGRKNFKL